MRRGFNSVFALLGRAFFKGSFGWDGNGCAVPFFFSYSENGAKSYAGALASASHRPSGSSPGARNDRIRKQETGFRDQNLVPYLRYFQLGALFAADKKVHDLSISCILCTFFLDFEMTVW